MVGFDLTHQNGFCKRPPVLEVKRIYKLLFKFVLRLPWFPIGVTKLGDFPYVPTFLVVQGSLRVQCKLLKHSEPGGFNVGSLQAML